MLRPLPRRIFMNHALRKPVPYPESWMNEAGIASNATLRDFAEQSAPKNMAIKYAVNGTRNHGDTKIARRISAMLPRTNRAGRVCTSLREPG